MTCATIVLVLNAAGGVRRLLTGDGCNVEPEPEPEAEPEAELEPEAEPAARRRRAAEAEAEPEPTEASCRSSPRRRAAAVRLVAAPEPDSRRPP